MPNYVTITSDKSKKVAFILCLFGGFFGFHYFYVGRYVRGFVAFFTMNFFIFGWLFDLMKITNGKFKDNIGQYLRH